MIAKYLSVIIVYSLGKYSETKMFKLKIFKVCRMRKKI